MNVRHLLSRTIHAAYLATPPLLLHALPGGPLKRDALATIEKHVGKMLGKGWVPSLEREVRMAASRLQLDPIVIDAGANVGDWTHTLLNIVKPRRVILIEPQADLFARLQARYAGHTEITLVNAALSVNDGQAALFGSPSAHVLASLHQRDLRRFALEHEMLGEVPTITLASLLVRERIEMIDLLKLDIEGHEFAVLAQARELLPRITTIAFEFGGTDIDARVFFRDFWGLLSPLFDVYRMSASGLVEIESYGEREESFVPSTFVAINRSSAVRG